MFLGDKSLRKKLTLSVWIATIAIIPLGIPAILIYEPDFRWDWFSYLFLCLHGAIILSTYHATILAYDFLNEQFFSLMDNEHKDKIFKIWKVLLWISIVGTPIFYGLVALSDWGKFTQNPKLVMGTPMDDNNYGSLFSFGPWGWTIFALFAYASILSQNFSIGLLLVFWSIFWYKEKKTAAEKEAWKELEWLYLANLVWLVLFTLPYSFSNGKIQMIDYTLVMTIPTVIFALFNIFIHELDFKHQPQSIQEPIQDIVSYRRNQFETIKRMKLLKTMTIFGAIVTFTAILFRYLETDNNMLTNPIAIAVTWIVPLSLSFADLKSAKIEERSLAQEMRLFKGQPIQQIIDVIMQQTEHKHMENETGKQETLETEQKSKLPNEPLQEAISTKEWTDTKDTPDTLKEENKQENDTTETQQEKPTEKPEGENDTTEIQEEKPTEKPEKGKETTETQQGDILPKTFKPDQNIIHIVLKMNFDELFVLHYIVLHSQDQAIPIVELVRIYPNSERRLRDAIDDLTEKGHLVKIPILGQMNRRAVRPTESGLQIAYHFQYISNGLKQRSQGLDT